jgi:hypothetical protein
MLSIAGFIAQEEVNGKKIFENLNEKSWDDIFTPDYAIDIAQGL